MNLTGKIITKYFDAQAFFASRLVLRHFETNSKANELKEMGIVILPELFSQNFITKINYQNKRFFDLSTPQDILLSPDGKAILETKDLSQDLILKFYFLHIKNFQTQLDVYKEIIPLIHSILTSYYHSHYYVRDIYCYRTQPISSVQGSYEWHIDNYPRGSLKVMIYLTDVPLKKGPFTYALKSHIGFQPELGKIGDRFKEEYVRSNFKIIDCLGKAGTTIIFNNNGIHRATDPQEDYRDVINFTVFPCLFNKKNKNHVKGLDLNTEKNFLKKYTR